MKGIFTLTWLNVKNALIYGVLTLIGTFGLSIAQSILSAGSIFGLNWNHIVDGAVIATLPVLITILSLSKNFLTNNEGKFLGITTVVPPDGQE